MWVVNSGMQVGNEQQCRQLNKTFNEALYFLSPAACNVGTPRDASLRCVAILSLLLILRCRSFIHLFHKTLSSKCFVLMIPTLRLVQNLRNRDLIGITVKLCRREHDDSMVM